MGWIGGRIFQKIKLSSLNGRFFTRERVQLVEKRYSNCKICKKVIHNGGAISFWTKDKNIKDLPQCDYRTFTTHC